MIGLAALALVGGGVFIDIIHMQVTKFTAFEEARRLSGGRGIVNVGAGPHRVFGAQIMAEAPEVLANIDIVPDGLPCFIQLDIEKEQLPFADKQFGVAFASHILEHLDDWQFALSEMVRVADHVVVVVPHPCYFSGWICLEHKQHFSVDDIDKMIELHPSLVVYY